MKQFMKLIAAFSAAIVIFTGCGQTDEQRAVFPETMTEIDCTVTEEITETDVQNTSEEKLFTLEIQRHYDYAETYEWRIIGSLEAAEELSDDICAPLDELYKWCSDIDFSKEIVFVDFDYSCGKAVDAYIENGMVFFEVSQNQNEVDREKISLIAAAVPREEIEVLMFEVHNLTWDDAVYIFGSSEALEFCSSNSFLPEYTSLYYENYQPFYVYGKRIAEWSKNVDFSKYAVVLKTEYFGSSSYEETLKNGIYIENEKVIFDYEVTCPSVMTCDIQTLFIAGVVPKDELSFLEMDDPSGFCRLLPEQYE